MSVIVTHTDISDRALYPRRRQPPARHDLNPPRRGGPWQGACRASRHFRPAVTARANECV